jgi:hypothetical protein
MEKLGGRKMGWENIILTLLGGFLASFSGILVERWRESRRMRERHFEDIKDRFLKPILEELHNLRGYFEFGESRGIWRIQDLEERLKSDIRWWEYFSFKNVSKVHKLLYEDLKNHYPDLYRDLKNIETWMRSNYAEYLQAIHGLLKTIEEDQEFKAFSKEFQKGFLDATSSYPLDAIFLLALGVDKSVWPNIYLYVKPKLDKMRHLENKFYNSVKAQKVRNIVQNMLTTINGCINRVEEIILDTKLKGKCRYLK